jgi:DNA polymerase-4
MALPINRNQPLIMHVDLNSCFATIEQQANPLFRRKLLVVAAYNTPGGTVVAPSIEAKRYGIKTGMAVRDARLLYPGVIVRPPDPPKYRAVHLLFRKIFTDYSPDVSPKSIDEAVIDFTDTYALYHRTLPDIGREIKRQFREEIGEWMRCSIGISTNRFLAKLAASFQKPDGLTIIDHTTVLKVYQAVSLLDLNGINTRYQAKLNANGIFTPMEFYEASLDTLKKQVFLEYPWLLLVLAA